METSVATKRFESLDALRGVAIFSVMLLHFGERGIASGDSVVHGRIWPLLQHGYLGVQLFFVISGYCITAALYSSRSKEQAFRYFVVRRLRRVFPPYWASLAFVLGLGLATIFILKTPSEVVFPLSPFDWLCNLLLVQEPFHATNANLVYWSLSIEIQFYLVIAVSLLFPRLIEQWLLLVTAIWLFTEWSGRISTNGTVLAFWPQFLTGIVAYYFITGKPESRGTAWLLLAAVLAPSMYQSAMSETLVVGNGHLIHPLKNLFCLVCLLILIGVHRMDAQVNRMPISRAFAFLGVMSYSLYLTHVPIGTRVFNGAERLADLQGISWLVCMIFSLILSFVLGYFFYRIFECPWLNSGSGQSLTGRLSGPRVDSLKK